MSRAIDDLSSEIRPLIFQVLARLIERGYPIMIVQTLRTAAEHQANLASGASAVTLSKHLPRSLRGWHTTDLDTEKCDAIDLCPFETWQMHGPDKLNWDDDNPVFSHIGLLGEGLGLRWGGNWTKPHDVGHLELLFPGEHYKDIPATSAAYQDHGVHA